MPVKDFFATRIWSPPRPWLHVLALVDHAPAVAELVGRHQTALADVDAVLPVPAEWLHLTVANLVPAAGVAVADRARLLAALADVCAQIEPIRITVGPGQAGRSHVRLAVHPEEPLRQLMTAVSATAAAVLDRPITPPSDLPHLTVGYGIRDDPTADLCVVNDVGGRVEIQLREVVLVDEVQEPGAGYRWTGAVPLELAGAQQGRDQHSRGARPD